MSQFVEFGSKYYGEQISSVKYYGLYGDRPDEWFEDIPYNEIDCGVEIKTTNGVFCVIWDAEYFNYGLKIEECKFTDLITNGVFADVTSTRAWSKCKDKVIRSITVFWRNAPEEEYTYPYRVDIEIEENSTVSFFAAKLYEEKKAIFPYSDSVTVVFNDEMRSLYEAAF